MLKPGNIDAREVGPFSEERGKKGIESLCETKLPSTTELAFPPPAALAPGQLWTAIPEPLCAATVTSGDQRVHVGPLYFSHFFQGFLLDLERILLLFLSRCQLLLQAGVPGGRLWGGCRTARSAGCLGRLPPESTPGQREPRSWDAGQAQPG